MDEVLEQIRNVIHKKLKKELGKGFKPEITETIICYLSNQQLVYDDKEHKKYMFLCPHCLGSIEVLYQQVACKIFRHACYYRKIGKNIILGNLIEPHTKKEICDQLVAQNKVIGCAKPILFVFDRKNDQHHVEICGYI